MIKMIIADDDRLIRESLSQLIDWESYGILVTAVAQTGDEALSQILSLRPDILLTDIEMPHMTGIQLLSTLRHENIPCEVIFLSAYSNFSYAQEAVRYGAFNYLLKPVDESQLINTITRCRNQILLRQNEQQLISQDRQIHTMAYTNELKSLILQSGQDSGSPADAQLLRIIGFPQDENTSIGAIYLKADKQELEAAELPSDNTDACSLQLLPLSANESMLLFLAPTSSAVRLSQYLEQYAHQIFQALPHLKHVFISTVHTCKDIGCLYPECSFAGLLLRFYGDKPISFFHEVYSHFDDIHPLPDARQLLQSFHEDNHNIDTTLQSLFLSFIHNGMLYNLHDVKLCCLSLLDGLGHESNPFSCSITDWESDFMFSFKKDILACGSIAATYDTMQRILYKLFDHSSMKYPPKSRLIQKALQYIRENYDHATLADVSAQLYISPSYLSRLFASEMDESFSRYLMRYRINIAKKQLRNPEAKLYAIAESVGYSDLAHFSKAFKLIENTSPGKYRKEHCGL